MPIEPDIPPMESLQALEEMVATAPQEYRSMIRAVLENVPQHWPHRIYCAGLEAIVAAQGLNQAAPIGWRYLTRSGSDRNYAIEVQMDNHGQHHFAKLDKGPYIDGFYQEVTDEVLAQEVGAATFTPAVLRINALAIVAVWLRHPAPEQEIIIPLPPTPRYLAPRKKYAVQQFLERLQSVAQDKLNQDFSEG